MYLVHPLRLFKIWYRRRIVLDVLKLITWQRLFIRASTCVLLKVNDFICFPVFCFYCWEMGICRSSAYWYWSMSRPYSKETCTDKIFDQEEEWQFLEKGILKKTCSARICMTCQHFNFSSAIHCRTIVSCHVHRRLMPPGDHLISRCHLWMRQLERDWLVSRGNLTVWLDRKNSFVIFDHCMSVMTFIDNKVFCINLWIFSRFLVMYF